MLFGKHVNKYYLKYSLYYIVGIIALVFVDRYQLKIPDIIGNIIDGLEYKTLTVELLKGFMLELMQVALVLFIGRFLWRICLLGNGVRVESDLRNKLFKAMIKLSQRFFSENKTGNLMSLYTNDLGTVRQAFGSGVMMLVDALCLGILTLIKMFQLNVVLTFVNLGTLLIISGTTFIVSKKIRKATKENFEAEFKKTLKKYGISEPYQGSFPKKLKGYKSTLTSRVEMQFKLEAAIEAEEYEKAAFYRDYLKVLNKEASSAADPSQEKVTFDTDSDSDIDLDAPKKRGSGGKNGKK